MHDPLLLQFSAKANFGKSPIIIFRHGFRSQGSIFDSLRNAVSRDFLSPILESVTYNWRDPVIINGLELASTVNYLSQKNPDMPVYLVGHSMGGLVCRLAIAALNDPAAMASHLGTLAFSWNFDKQRAIQMCNMLVPTQVSGLVTLATPNCGAVTHGQAAMFSYIARATFGSRVPSLVDLTTINLFQFLQYYATDVPTLSVSGSALNAFSSAMTTPLKLALRLSLPNDGIVEDVSVDLQRSVLANEISGNPRDKYVHLRAYENCTGVWHTNIYDDPAVERYVLQFIART